jgi:hypothetical protein
MPQWLNRRQILAWLRRLRWLRIVGGKTAGFFSLYADVEDRRARAASSRARDLHSEANPILGIVVIVSFLMQTFAVPVVVLHCHCVLTAAIAKGRGRVNLTERKAATQASVTMVTMSAISWRVHNVQVMAFTPVPLAGE